MSLRWKLLFVLLAVSLAPLAVMHFFATHAVERLGEDLADHSRTALLKTAAFEFKRTAKEQARAMDRQRSLLTLALRIQASELSWRLTHDLDADQHAPHWPRQGSDNAFAQTRCILRGPRECTPLPVDFEKQTVVVLSGHGVFPGEFREDAWTNATLASRLPSLLEVYRSIAAEQPGSILWQWSVLEAGVLSLYPRTPKPKRALAEHFMRWFENVRSISQPTWRLAGPDPFTMEPIFTLAAPLSGPDGEQLGVTAISSPVSALVSGEEALEALSPRLAAFLVSQSSNAPGLEILAGKETDDRGRRRWRWYLGRRALGDGQADLASVERDLAASRSGVVSMPFRGEPSLWAYTPLDEFGAGLLLVAPVVDLAAEADAMEEYVLASVDQQIRLTGTVMLGLFALLAVTTFFLSRPLLRRANALAEASRQLAEGDFSVRVTEEGDDELTMVSRSFNRTVPALEERIRLKQSLEIAHDVQQTLLPNDLPDREGIDTAAVVSYSEETGGDFYDLIEPRGRNKPCIGALVADVSGHGMPAALLMASTRAFLRARFLDQDRGQDIAAAVSDANRLLYEDEEGSGRFVTLFYLEVDLESNEMSWVRAGHVPALLYDIESDSFEELEGPPGLALGVDPDTEYKAFATGCLCSGQIAVLYTDGLTESADPQGEQFGRDRLRRCIRKNADRSAAAITKGLLGEATRFRNGAPQSDDITIVVLKIQAPADR